MDIKYKREKEMETLGHLGMVHVTGLPIQDVEGSLDNGRPISAHRSDWGKYGKHHGMIVAILETGEVFLSAFTNDIYNRLPQICPKGAGAGVPCSNGGSIHSYHFLCRSADQMWNGDRESYQFHPDPELAECALERWEEVKRNKEARAKFQTARIDDFLE